MMYDPQYYSINIAGKAGISMKNVEMTVNGDKLTITVDLTQRLENQVVVRVR